jgi:AraC family transcriptional regulator, regulatory protein of adaptative response / methylphosphotriester-DNA alkyltransferase methyltransferase
MQKTAAPKSSLRQKEITTDYIKLLDEHMQDLKAGTVTRAFEIRDLAAKLHVHPVHLSNTIKEVTGQSTCDHYENRLVTVAKELLATTNLSIGAIALQMTYDPSNFTKFFKHFTGLTPKQYRQQMQQHP